jgi:hypothetical protein
LVEIDFHGGRGTNRLKPSGGDCGEHLLAAGKNIDNTSLFACNFLLRIIRLQKS